MMRDFEEYRFMPYKLCTLSLAYPRPAVSEDTVAGRRTYCDKKEGEKYKLQAIGYQYFSIIAINSLAHWGYYSNPGKPLHTSSLFSGLESLVNRHDV
jgi:hypothetical protein